jgi:formate-dependent nitrite reductase membrane component NrfD
VQRRSNDHAEMLARLSVGLGIVLGAYTGILLGTLGARAAYNSVMLAPLFLVSGVSTAAALMMLFPVSPGEHVALRRWDILAIGVEIIVLALLFIGFAGAGAAGQKALSLFFGGDFTVAFWSLVVVSGLVIPATLEILETRRNLRPTALAPVLALGGGLALRFIVVVAGQS